ncbi:hypothetical protein BH11PLA2_BH11PLA2_41680 [soil metagenome]
MAIASLLINFLRTTIAIITVMAFGTGCGKSNEEPWGKVQGTVTFQGKPVENAILLFSNSTLGIDMTTFTDKDGRFEIHTAKVGGLPVGTYRISISPYTPSEQPTDTIVFDKKAPVKAFENIPMLYRNIATSGLTAEVTAGENDFQFEMKPTK